MKWRWSYDRSRRLRTGVLVAAAPLVLATMTMTSTPAQAAAPANDAWTSASRVASLPFKATVDTTEATTDPGTRGINARSVWWRVRLVRGGPVLLTTQGTNYHVHLRLFHAATATDTPDMWTGMGGVVGGGMVRQLKAGEFYYVMLATHSGRRGGLAKLTVKRPAHASFRLAKTGRFSHIDGSAFLHGAVKSTQPSTARLTMRLRQLVGGQVVAGSGSRSLAPKRTWSTWVLRVSGSRSFKTGPARLTSGVLTLYDTGVRVQTIRIAPTIITLK